MTRAEQLPLAGKRIVVTRAPEQSGDLVRQLEQLGAEVLSLPAVSFADPPDFEALDGAIDLLPQFHWLLFTSQNAVRFLAKRCRQRAILREDGGWASSVAELRVSAVGPATAEAARQEGLRVDFVASRFRAAALAEELGPQLAGKRVLLPCSNRAGAELSTALAAEGANVVEVIAYWTVVPLSFDPAVSVAIARGEVDVVTFMSPSAFHHLAESVGWESLRALVGRVAFAAIGPVTAGAIRETGLPAEIEAREASAASLVAAISHHFNQRLPSGVKLP